MNALLDTIASVAKGRARENSALNRWFRCNATANHAIPFEEDGPETEPTRVEVTNNNFYQQPKEPIKAATGAASAIVDPPAPPSNMEVPGGSKDPPEKRGSEGSAAPAPVPSALPSLRRQLAGLAGAAVLAGGVGGVAANMMQPDPEPATVIVEQPAPALLPITQLPAPKSLLQELEDAGRHIPGRGGETIQ